MNKSDASSPQTANDPIRSHYQLTSTIRIHGFNNMVENDQVSMIQVFYERLAQEIYNTRKKNYSWGFRVIEPEFFNHADRINLVSKIYREEDLDDLNSLVFKLFVEFNNLILSTALHMHIPITGIIRIGEAFRGSISSRKPAVVSGKDPLILSELLKVFSFNEIFPDGFSEGLIPAVHIPYHFGRILCKSELELSRFESVGIFLPTGCVSGRMADVTILANMIVETKINDEKVLVCNWKEWMREHTDCSVDNVIAFAEAEAKNKDSAHSGKWKSLIEYASHL